MPTPAAALRFLMSLLLFVTALVAQANWQLQGGPSSRVGAAMAFDPLRARAVWFGGHDGGLRDDTWVWDGTSWQQLQRNIT